MTDTSGSSSARRPMQSVATLLASGFGSGFAPIAPGTWGSAMGLLLACPWWGTSSVGLQVAAAAIVLMVGTWAGEDVASRLGDKDPSLVVIDEIAGMWVTLIALPWNPVTVVTGFFMFRLFDVFKPYPARDLERVPGGWGIMLDDIVAGIYANLAVRVVLLVWPAW